MKKQGILLLFFILSIFLVACGNQSKKEEPNREPVKVELSVPDSGEPGDSILIRAYVTQGKDIVDDADEVMFEIWRDGQKDDSLMLDYDHLDEGTYSIEHTFSESGVYHIQVHVTARRMHVMPKDQIVIEKMDE